MQNPWKRCRGKGGSCELARPDFYIGRADPWIKEQNSKAGVLGVLRFLEKIYSFYK
jgi:hypothetical protein